MTNSIQRVTLTIETENGELHKMVVHRPAPTGANPAFMQQQLDTAVAELQRRGEDLLLTYGRQVAVLERLLGRREETSGRP